METLSVNLPDGRAYPVLIGADIFAAAAGYAPPHAAVVSNAAVFELYGGRLMRELRAADKRAFPVLVADGERHKNMETLNAILDAFLRENLRRDGGVIALGGGVIGDLAGFAAAVHLRGVPVVQMPTTLLAQVDAAIGGKTGVNHARGKNLIGAFHQPAAVLCDIAALSSLPAREYRAGLAEVIKYGLLGDAAFFSWLEKNRNAVAEKREDALLKIVGVSAKKKAEIVAADEKETGGARALLNLGHTFAHAAEAAAGYGAWLHGEAVAFGLAAAALLSEKVAGFAAADTARIRDLLRALSLPVSPPPVSDEALLAAMDADKKNTTAAKRFVLMRAIGDAFVCGADEAAVRRTLAEMR